MSVRFGMRLVSWRSALFGPFAAQKKGALAARPWLAPMGPARDRSLDQNRQQWESEISEIPCHFLDFR
jgi:hypothetical protein